VPLAEAAGGRTCGTTISKRHVAAVVAKQTAGIADRQARAGGADRRGRARATTALLDLGWDAEALDVAAVEATDDYGIFAVTLLAYD